VLRQIEARILTSAQRPVFKNATTEHILLAQWKLELLAVHLRWEFTAVADMIAALFDEHRARPITQHPANITLWVFKRIITARLTSMRLDVSLSQREGLLPLAMSNMENREWFVLNVRAMADKMLTQQLVKNVPNHSRLVYGSYGADSRQSSRNNSRDVRNHSRNSRNERKSNRGGRSSRASASSAPPGRSDRGRGRGRGGGSQRGRGGNQHEPSNAYRADGSPNYDAWENFWMSCAARMGVDWVKQSFCIRVNLGTVCRDENRGCRYLHKCGFCKQNPHHGGFRACPKYISYNG
jgi:hypothetical protein